MPRAGVETVPFADRFWSKVDIRGSDECWPWLAGKGRRGYGLFSVGNRPHVTSRQAHRIAYELSHGVELTDRKVLVCHSCDNPPCCNPAHLVTGSHAYNAWDMVRKGRGCSMSGERNPNAKLTAEHVEDIRRRHVPYKVSCRQLAEEYGVCESAIKRVVQGRSWVLAEAPIHIVPTRARA